MSLQRIWLWLVSIERFLKTQYNKYTEKVVYCSCQRNALKLGMMDIHQGNLVVIAICVNGVLSKY